jgi:hypothetical protein
LEALAGSAAAGSPPGPRRPGLAGRAGYERRHLALAIGLSLLLHALFFSLSFSGQGLGLPGFGLPWRERRVEAPEMRFVLLPAPGGAAQSPGAAVLQPAAARSIEPPAASDTLLVLPTRPVQAQPTAMPPMPAAAPPAPQAE